MSSDLLFEVREHCARITLNRPEARNALTPPMVQELADILRQTEADAAVRCVLLSSMGTDFSVGGEFMTFRATLDQAAEQRRHA